MKKLKKKKAVFGTSIQNVRRNRLFFAGACVAGLVVCVGIIYGYWAVSNWLVTRELQQLNSDNEDARILGMRNAARARNVDRIPRICDLLRTDPSQKLRSEAIAAVVRMNSKKAAPTLVYALGDEIDAVANESMAALQTVVDKNLDWPNVIDWWSKNKDTYAGWAYHRPGDDGVPVVDAMQKLLKSESKFTRFGAVARLARLKNPAAAAALTIATADSDEKVRTSAADALAAIASRAAK